MRFTAPFGDPADLAWSAYVFRGAVLQKRKGEPRCGELPEKDAAKLQARKMEELEIAKMRAGSRAAKSGRTMLLEAGLNKV